MCSFNLLNKFISDVFLLLILRILPKKAVLLKLGNNPHNIRAVPVIHHAVKWHAYVVSETTTALLDEDWRQVGDLHRSLDHHLGVLKSVCGSTSAVIALRLSILERFILKTKVFVFNPFSKVFHSGVKEADEVRFLIYKINFEEIEIEVLQRNCLRLEEHIEKMCLRVAVRLRKMAWEEVD
jgi:hypothetical protein